MYVAKSLHALVMTLLVASPGDEFQVNTYTSSFQMEPVVASDAVGNFVVVWTDFFQDGDQDGLRGQRFDAAGNALGGEFQINTYTTRRQTEPSIASAADGDFVVVWSSFEQDGWNNGVFGQRFNSSGSRRAAEFQVNVLTIEDQRLVSVASDPEGDFVVVWASDYGDGSSGSVRGRRYASSGAALGGEFQINTYTTGSQYRPDVDVDLDGDFVVVWDSFSQVGSRWSVHGQRFSSSGNPRGGEFLISASSTQDQIAPEVIHHSNGRFTVLWGSDDIDGSGEGIAARRYNAAGNPISGVFRINIHTTSTQRVPTVARDADGKFVAVWPSFNQDGSHWSVQARRFLSNATPVTDEFQVNVYTNGAQYRPAVASDADGNFVVVWQSAEQDGSNYSVQGRLFCPTTIEIFFDSFESGDTGAWF